MTRRRHRKRPSAARSRDADAPQRIELELHPDLLLDPAALRDRACRAAHLDPRKPYSVDILRRSIDARRGRVRVHVALELRTSPAPPSEPRKPEALPSLGGDGRVVIVGAGPAGLFCALGLARRGVRAILLERGRELSGRRRDVARLSQRGQLDPESNYCFGEGGAGTFSDGKLYTRADKRGPVRDVLEALVGYGAPAEILVDARPHIGTNRLPGVVSALRAHLESAGQLLHFGARMVALLTRDGRVTGVELADGQRIEAEAVVLATGHSAHDVYRIAADAGAALVPKPFAMGVRVEHPQAFIDRLQYGDLAGHPALGAASYRLVERAGPHGVFSFCNCPGGHVVPAATAAGRQVVNGWSPSQRRGRFSNSGLVVEVSAEVLAQAGLDPSDPFAGLAYQRALEERAYAAGGGAFVAPAQRLSDLLGGRISTSLPQCSYPRGLQSAALGPVLGELADPLRQALSSIERRMPGFAGHDAVALGVESRTSAPLRIPRDRDTLESPGCAGLYPTAEGAGYAGGIMSAALDGLRVAERIAERAAR
ncbi:MAG: FAD-binding protein [Myxococcales bacterium]|nr:FAD-binding protein [Myxococcales bacterium]